MSRLTARQERFISEYLVTGSGAESARRAGYSTKTARQIATTTLSKVYIQDALAAKRAELAVTLEIDRNAIIGGIFEAIATAKASADAGNVIKGWTTVAKLLGLDQPDATPTRRSDGTCDALRMKLEALPDDVLADIASGRRGVP